MLAVIAMIVLRHIIIIEIMIVIHTMKLVMVVTFVGNRSSNGCPKQYEKKQTVVIVVIKEKETLVAIESVRHYNT